MLRCLSHGAPKVEEEEEVDPRQLGIERLRVNGGDLASPRGRRLNRWRKNVQSGKS